MKEISWTSHPRQVQPEVLIHEICINEMSFLKGLFHKLLSFKWTFLNDPSLKYPSECWFEKRPSLRKTSGSVHLTLLTLGWWFCLSFVSASLNRLLIDFIYLWAALLGRTEGSLQTLLGRPWNAKKTAQAISGNHSSNMDLSIQYSSTCIWSD